jgi:hypothetical protein
MTNPVHFKSLTKDFLKKRQKRNKKRKIQQSEPFKEKHELPVRQCCFSRAKRGLSGFDLAL